MTRRGGGALAVLLLAGAGCAPADLPWTEPPPLPLDLRCSAVPASVALLQPFTLQLDLYRAHGTEVEFAPAVPADFTGEVVRADWRPFGRGESQRTTLTLRAVRGPGELSVPAFTARGKDGSAASTAAAVVTVTSLLAGAAPALEAPGAPFPVRVRYGLWALLAVGAVLLLTGMVAFWRRRPGRRTPAAVPLSPHARALRALARLRHLPRTTDAQVEAFYVEVSAVLRVYLEERFGLRAPERTTEEFLQELAQQHDLLGEQRPQLERFLSQCDLVKFAAQFPGEPVHQETFAIAEQFVETTRADRAVPPATVAR
ncbi:MAG TPA: DUF4381 family protein [Planctomycetota bacterium]|nr:DUF4381 family protein [Planctomycetota bacterium]